MNSTPALSIFRSDSINVESAVENLEEAEDLEDQRRRQEEIQSLLLKNMDEFNYDDQSTIHSSPNISTNELDDKYKNASINDQIKVLYEIRVREVNLLNEKVEELQTALTEEKSNSAKKLMLSEAEKEQALVSLKNSQEILVRKKEEIGKLTTNTENFQKHLLEAENKYNMINDEVKALRVNNADLLQQLLIMKQGHNSNTISERQMQENLNTEINKLNFNLDKALKCLEQKEEELYVLHQKILQGKNERDEIISEKNEIIFNLTENLEECREKYVKVVKKIELLREENTKLKSSIKDLDLTNSLATGLTDKTEIIKVLQKELEKSNVVQMKHLAEYEKLQEEYSELNKSYGILKNNLQHSEAEKIVLLKSFETTENTLKSKEDEIKVLLLKLERYNKVETENKNLLTQINELEEIAVNLKNKNYIETSMQTSQNINSFCVQTNESLYLDPQKNEIQMLKSQLKNYEEEINELKLKICLEHEREKLIQNLQQKAKLFEQIIQESNKNKSTIGTNTENDMLEDSLLKELFETKLIEKEIELRVKIEEEFGNKLINRCPQCEELADQIKQFMAILNDKNKEITELKKDTLHLRDTNEACNLCSQFSQQLKDADLTLQREKSFLIKVKTQQLKDREILTKVLQEWREKFEELEMQNQQLNHKCIAAEAKCVEFQNKLEIREKGDEDLLQELQKETQNLLKDWNLQALQGIHKLTASHYDKVLESRKKIDRISKKTDKKVKDIEEMFLKSKDAIIKNFKD